MADESAASSTATPTASESTTVSTPAPAPVETEASPDTQMVQPAAMAGATPTAAAASTPPSVHDNLAVKVYHGIMGALGGTQDTSYERGPDGKMIVSQTPSGPGSQWKRIIAGAVGGTAAGLGAGPGPGQLERAAGAGINAGMSQVKAADDSKRQQADQDYDSEQKTLVQKAQTQALTQATATSAFKLSQMQVEAKQGDADRENAFVKMIQGGGDGSQDLGVAKSFGDVIQMHQDMPGLMTQNAHGNIISTAHVDSDGKFDGVRFALVTPEWKAAKLDSDQTFFKLQPPTKPGEQPTVAKQTVRAGTMSNGDFANAQSAANAEILKWHEDDRKQTDLEKQQKGTLQKDAAESAKDYAEASKAKADAAKASAEAKAIPSADNLSDSEIVKGMLDGSVDITKTASIRGNRREAYIAAAKQQDPNFNMQDYSTRLKTRQSFASGKDADQITSFNAFLGHVTDASQLVNNLRNTKVPWINIPLNKLRTMAAGNPAINSYVIAQDAAKDEFQSFLNNNRALHESDKAEGKKMINEDQSPAQQQGAYKQFVTTAAIRMSALNHKYSSVFHVDYPGMLDEDGQAALKHFGVPESMVYHHPTGVAAPATTPPGATAPPPAPATHVFSLSAWQKANPQGDASAASAAAKKAGYTVGN